MKNKKMKLLITRGIVVLPNTKVNIEIGRKISVNAIKSSLKNNEQLIVVSQKNPTIDSPKKNDLFKFGTLCDIKLIHESTEPKNESYTIECSGVARVQISDMIDSKTHYEAKYVEINDSKELDSENYDKINDLLVHYENDFAKIASLNKTDLKKLYVDKSKKVAVLDLIAEIQKFEVDQKQKLLEELNPNRRLEIILALLLDDNEAKKIDQEISKKINANLAKQQKEFYLRERVKAIKEELGDISSKEDDADFIREKIKGNPYPEHIKKRILSEINKMESSSNSNEYSISKAYIDWIMQLPWWEKTVDNNSIVEVEKILNKNHYGLDKVKERIVEYLAVRMKSQKVKGSIICFVGPPGVGKTSLAMSISEALNKKFVKISLGGMRDESELKGHRKTYIGAMPGRIIKAMAKSTVLNPVFLLDEIDKLASDHRGDPASALLDILDSEQNNRFSDNYIEEDYDLSNVLFIATANYEENIPAPLHDRLEIIRLSSYTQNEKKSIAKTYLVDKVFKESSLKKDELKFTDEAFDYIINRYTREAGVRELERCIRQIARKFIVRQEKEKLTKEVVDPEKVVFYLKKEIYDHTTKDKEATPGVVNGMAYTTAGGDLLPIEVTYSKGKGKIEITGNLKETMKESASVALGYVKSNATKYDLDPDIFSKIDIHIHVPSGGIPKDGPSAGIALTTAILSSLKNVKIPSNVAMTGEITLRGKVLIIGGVKEKTISAYRGGVNKIFMPREDQRYLEDIPHEILSKINITLVDNYDDVYKSLFQK